MILPDRIMSKISPEPNSGCHLWMGAIQRQGYGNVRHQGRVWLAHRLIYELVRGSVPAGLELDHLCRVRSCVNPQHLEPVTRKENLRRSPIHKANKTHCPVGHEYDEANTKRIGPNGIWRKCLACEKAYIPLHRRGQH